jgi:RNase P/RNase MRP subunit p29
MTRENIENCNKLVKFIEEMETRLDDEPVILDTEEILFQELEKTSQAIEELQQLTSHADDFTQLLVSKNVAVLKERIQKLYGRIHNLAVDGEFMLLRVEALLLGRALLKENRQDIDGQLDELQGHLVLLKNNFRSSLRNQLVQDTAEQFLAKVPALENEKTTRSAAIKSLENKMQKLLKEDLFDNETLGLIAEILEEADARNIGQRREFIDEQIKDIFSHDPEIAEALLSMDL